MATLTTSANSVVYDVVDMKIYPMLTDTIGASPTYSTGFDVPGIAEVSVDPNIQSSELKGDARVIAKKGRTDRINIKAKWGRHHLSVMQTILGGLTGVNGTTPNSKAGYRLASPGSLPYFRVDFLVTDLDLGYGSLWVICWKCQLTDGSLVDTSTDNFSQPSMSAEAIALDGDVNKLYTGGVDTGAMVDFLYNETATSLTTTAVSPA